MPANIDELPSWTEIVKTDDPQLTNDDRQVDDLWLALIAPLRELVREDMIPARTSEGGDLTLEQTADLYWNLRSLVRLQVPLIERASAIIMHHFETSVNLGADTNSKLIEATENTIPALRQERDHAQGQLDDATNVNTLLAEQLRLANQQLDAIALVMRDRSRVESDFRH